jgi:prevent-host-death family protein
MISLVMKSVGVAEVKARLSEYLARVRAGGELLITDHGRPIARIVPVSARERELAELERQGLIRVGSMQLPQGFLDAPRSTPTGPTVTEALLEDRREGR